MIYCLAGEGQSNSLACQCELNILYDSMLEATESVLRRLLSRVRMVECLRNTKECLSNTKTAICPESITFLFV